MKSINNTLTSNWFFIKMKSTNEKIKKRERINWEVNKESYLLYTATNLDLQIHWTPNTMSSCEPNKKVNKEDNEQGIRLL